ncbi:MAG: 30S ribosome-binding factor RbfA [Deltaproteobacteria bacterium]|nr:30S ribosome-binding factor RbfA [Deltaproteobacteria bacterium]
MSARRADRIAVRVQEEVTALLQRGVSDPRVGMISIVSVAVNDDLSVARIKWLPFGGIGDRAQIAEGLKAIAPQIRGPVGRALGIRHAPELRFELDANVEYAAHMDEVFARLARERLPPE